MELNQNMIKFIYLKAFKAQNLK